MCREQRLDALSQRVLAGAGFVQVSGAILRRGAGERGFKDGGFGFVVHAGIGFHTLTCGIGRRKGSRGFLFHDFQLLRFFQKYLGPAFVFTHYAAVDFYVSL